MKRIFAGFCVALILLSFAFSAFSADIDGYDMGTEWDNAVSYKLVDGESNCGVNFGLVKAKFDNETSAVFLCFMFIDPNLKADNDRAGISISIESASSFELTMSDNPQNADVNIYSFDGAMSIDENNGATCEVRIGFKEGLPRTVDGEVRFIDSNGEPSNYYAFTLINEGYVEPTALEIAPTRDNDDPLYNPDLLTEKTTKKKTTAKSNNDKRVTRKTTTTKKSTTRWKLEDSPMIYTGRTKVQTKRDEKNDTSVQKDTVATPGGVTVYYYEKEVIISHVLVTVPITETITEEDEIQDSASSTVKETEIASTTSEIEAAKTAPVISLSEGTKYKKISVIIGMIAFCVIAALGAFHVRKKNKEIN